MTSNLLKLKTPKGSKINFEPIKLYEQDSLKDFFKSYIEKVEKPITNLHDRLCSKEDLEGKVAISLYLDKLMNHRAYSLPLHDSELDKIKNSHYQFLLNNISTNLETFQLEDKSKADVDNEKQNDNDDLSPIAEQSEDIQDIFNQLKKENIKSNISQKTSGVKRYSFKKLQETSINFVNEEIKKFIENKKNRNLEDYFDPQTPDFALAVIFYDFKYFKEKYSLKIGERITQNTKKEKLKQEDLIEFILQCLKELSENPLLENSYNKEDYNVFEIASNPQKFLGECKLSISSLIQKIEERFRFKSLNLILLSDFLKEVVTNIVSSVIRSIKTSPLITNANFDNILEFLIYYFVISYKSHKLPEINITKDPIFKGVLELFIKYHHVFTLGEDIFNSASIKYTFERLNFNYPQKSFKFKDNKNLIFRKDLDQELDSNSDTEDETESSAENDVYSDKFIRSYYAKSVIEFLSGFFKLSYDDVKLLLPAGIDCNNYMKRLSSYTLLNKYQNPKTPILGIKNILELLKKSNQQMPDYKFFITPEFKVLNADYLEYHNNLTLSLSKEALAIKILQDVHLVTFKLDNNLEKLTELQVNTRSLNNFNNTFFGTGDGFNKELLVFNI